ncbi:MAG TPA: hypothetical protein VMK83_07325 [Gaiellaceae bacterium]|nr:hypothetical protein [Gaiellaceae bacterium]
MLSSKSDSKQETRFAARLDVLLERVDTLATTVATTASAIAKKDGEIAGLRRDLQARDETLQALVAQARSGSQAPAGAPAVDVNELRSLRNAVAALTKERAQGEGLPQVEDLARKVHALGQRVEAHSTTLETLAERRSAEPERPPEELRGMLVTLRAQVEALTGLRAGVTEEQLDERLAGVDEATSRLSERIDSLASTIESAATSLGDKEHELAALHCHFTESSARIETIVEDIREALSAFPELGPGSVDELAARVERVVERVASVETSSRETADARERKASELTRRIDAIEQQVATVANEVARARTLWPVALRSLEARLDDVASHPLRLDGAPTQTPASVDVGGDAVADDDLLAGLRDSLHAMETVAAEMARASDALTPTDEQTDSYEQPVAVAGATIVPLRPPDP